jgi:hypothetical protein
MELIMTSVTDDTGRLLPITEPTAGTSVACGRIELVRTSGTLVICVSAEPPTTELITVAGTSVRDDTGISLPSTELTTGTSVPCDNTELKSELPMTELMTVSGAPVI